MNTFRNGFDNENTELKPENATKEKRRLLNVAVIAIAVVAVIGAAVVCLRTHHQNTYDKSVELALEGNWQDTIDTFQSLSKINYKASSDFYTFCKALKDYDEGNIEEAYDLMFHMYLSNVTQEQKLKMLEYWPEVRDTYEEKYGSQIPTIPSNSSGSNSGSSSNSSNSSNHSHSSGSHSSSSSDPYNASDYANEDDFWEDYYNDFIDFDEAEMYWEEHH